MRTACSQIAWGIGLTLFDFRINGFDLLPDVLGFILILIGLANLPDRQRGFGIAMAAAAVMLALSIAELAGAMPATVTISQSDRSYSLSALSAIGLSTLCMLALLYGLCEGFARTAASIDRMEAARSFRAVWHLSLAMSVIMLFVLPFGLNGIGFLSIVTLLAGLGQFAAGIWLIVLVRRFGREYAATALRE
ncbi:hypothetical protein SAMN05216312_105391 [Cohnella sp. OV330]|uniref:hypothetical protein n=1 Tax=Cohnella sp. OV330 TaxID=1855288 RepID=UPI0008EAB55D|nr:hypothetical protein [Cohnella sp. OV330]SFB30144.1 hypothetical protein SAMN05216312_105391 [Cohnella sp. OV330]